MSYLNLNGCLDKFIKAFPDLPTLKYYINNIVKPYCKDWRNTEHCQIITEILDSDVFTLRCRVGLVYCLIEYCYDEETDTTAYGATFENLDTNLTVFFQQGGDYNAQEVCDTLFDIFD